MAEIAAVSGVSSTDYLAKNVDPKSGRGRATRQRAQVAHLAL
jgi:hypothetical protein